MRTVDTKVPPPSHSTGNPDDKQNKGLAFAHHVCAVCRSVQERHSKCLFNQSSSINRRAIIYASTAANTPICYDEKTQPHVMQAPPFHRSRYCQSILVKDFCKLDTHFASHNKDADLHGAQIKMTLLCPCSVYDLRNGTTVQATWDEYTDRHLPFPLSHWQTLLFLFKMSNHKAQLVPFQRCPSCTLHTPTYKQIGELHTPSAHGCCNCKTR